MAGEEFGLSSRSGGYAPLEADGRGARFIAIARNGHDDEASRIAPRGRRKAFENQDRPYRLSRSLTGMTPPDPLIASRMTVAGTSISAAGSCPVERAASRPSVMTARDMISPPRSRFTRAQSCAGSIDPRPVPQ